MKKRLTAVCLAGVMSVTLLGGCGGINKNATVATMEGTQVSLGIANFYCRYQQAGIEDVYKMYFGDDVWQQDMTGSGSTMEQTMKENALNELHDMYTLKAHMDEFGVELTAEEQAKIAEVATAFMTGNSKDAIREMGATQEIVEEFLSLYTIQQKMMTAIKAKADVKVSDEEANMRGYTKLEISRETYVDDEGDTVNYTEDEAATVQVRAEAMLDELAAEGATLESVAEAHGYETTTDTYATYEEPKEDSGEEEGEDEDDPIMAALKGLKEGEVSGLIETDTAYYIVRVDHDTDTEATEKKRDSLIRTRQNEYYSEVLDGWQEEDGWQVKEKQFAKIQFVNSLTGTDPNAPDAQDGSADAAADLEE